MLDGAVGNLADLRAIQSRARSRVKGPAPPEFDTNWRNARDRYEAGRRTFEQKVERWRPTVKSWGAFTEDVLAQAFNQDVAREEFRQALHSDVDLRTSKSRAIEEFDLERQSILQAVDVLGSWIDRLALLPEPQSSTTPSSPAGHDAAPVSTAVDDAPSRKVFVVHGRDEGLRESVARVLERLEFEPIILAQQANAGRMIQSFPPIFTGWRSSRSTTPVRGDTGSPASLPQPDTTSI